MPVPNTISVDKLARLISTPSCPAVIDVRSYKEFLGDRRHVPGSLFRSSAKIAEWAPSLRGKSVVVVCEDGRRSSHGVAAWLRGAGVVAEALQGGLADWAAAELPMVPADKVRNRDERGRSVWVTRARPKVDRIAFPWLIRRFVDPEAVFLFVPPGEGAGVAEKFEAASFDIDDPGTLWSHRGELCTFDVMIDEFGLATPPLLHLATLVRGADTGRPDLAPAQACSRPRLASRASTRTTWSSSIPGCSSTTPSTAGAGTQRRRRTTGPRTSPNHGRDRTYPDRFRAVRGRPRSAAACDPSRGGAGLGPHRRTLLRRTHRADRDHASGPRRGEALDLRDRFLHALNFCTLLPGPEAQQLASYVGWLMHGPRGGLVAGGLFVLPGVVAIMALSWVYALYGNVGLVAGLFFGLKAAVLAIVLQALIRVGKRALKGPVMIGLAAAFVGIFFLDVPFPLIVLTAGVIGYLGGRAGLPQFKAGGHAAGGKAVAGPYLLDDHELPRERAAAGHTLRMLLVWGRSGLCRSLPSCSPSGRTTSSATARRDARRPRHGRDDAGAAHHGHPVRGVPRRLPGAGFATAAVDRDVGRAPHYLGDSRAVLPLDLRRRPLRRAPTRQSGARRRALGDYRGGGRRDPEPCGLVRAAHRLRRDPAVRGRTDPVRRAGADEPEPVGARPGGRGGAGGVPVQGRHGPDARGLRRGRRRPPLGGSGMTGALPR